MYKMIGDFLSITKNVADKRASGEESEGSSDLLAASGIFASTIVDSSAVKLR